MRARKLLEHLMVWFDLPALHVTQRCKLVEQDHKEDNRVYAHVFHKPKKTICLARAFDRLPLGHKIGIMLHEIGHLMSNGGEAEADLWVNDHLGIDIDFKNTIQWVEPGEVGL
jgi:hypothetical protein